MIISVSSGKAHDKLQHPFMTKKLSKRETEGNSLSLINRPVQKRTAGNTLNGKRPSAPPALREKKGACHHRFC